MKIRYILPLVAALAACSGGSRQSAPDVARGLFVDAEGLRPAGTTLRIDFGREQAGVIASVTNILGTAPASQSTNAECGAGPVTAVRWAEGITLNFQEEAFHGWVTDNAAFRSPTGVTVGQSREDAAAAGASGFSQTSLGTEFSAGRIYGIMDESGETVDLLFAGVTCFFR